MISALNCKNKGAMHQLTEAKRFLQLTKNPMLHERTKHIEINWHFTRDMVLEGLLQLAYIPTSK